MVLYRVARENGILAALTGEINTLYEENYTVRHLFEN